MGLSSISGAGRGLFLAVALLMPLCHSGPAGASPNVSQARPADAGAGGLFFVDAQGERVRATRLRTRVRIHVSGVVARATVIQRFRNDGSAWTEGVYVFPLPEQAAVDRLRMRVGNRVIEGEIRPRAAARRTYEQARSQGQRASLVEQERPNLFTTSVANIGPGQTIEVQLGYRERLRYADGDFHLRFPLAVTPRYIPGQPLRRERTFMPDAATGWAVPTDQVPDAPRITPRVLPPGLPSANPVDIAVTLDPGFPLGRLESPSHRIRIRELKGGLRRITPRRQVVASDRDFVLRWSPAPGREPRAALFGETVEGQRYVQLLLMPPQPRNARALAREVVFVIDVSGSMKGRSIRQARRAMDAALQRLKPRDRFNIITFSDGAQRLHPSAQPAQPAVVRQARAYVAGLDAGGGTNMAPALKLALSPAAAGHLRQVVFITDGAVGNEEALFRLIHQRLGGSRLFTVGIGSAPNAHFMRVAARFGRGSYTFVDRVGEVEQDIGALFRRIGAPVVRDIRVHWPGDAESYPERIPDLYAGEPLVVAARIGTGEGPVVVEGETDGQSWRRRVQIPAGFGRNGVSVLWARRRIAALMDEIRAGRAEAEVRPDVVATATAHHLVTRYTSLVAVDRAPGRPSGASLKREAVPANLPDGSDPSGFVTVMPRTATAAGMHLIAGLLLLLIAAVAWLLGHLGFRADEAAREP